MTLVQMSFLDEVEKILAKVGALEIVDKLIGEGWENLDEMVFFLTKVGLRLENDRQTH